MNRTLFVCTQMEAGGVQVLATGMAAALSAEGSEATVLFLYRKRVVFEGCGAAVLFPRKPAGLEFLALPYRLISFIRRYKPTAIVGMAHYSSPLACFAGMVCGVRRRVATQTSPMRSVNVFARAMDLVCGVLGVYTANVAASRTIEGGFRRFPGVYRRRLATIYNGVSVAPAADPVAIIRRDFNIPPGGFWLVSCGRLAAVKNHQLLLRVVARLPGVSLAIAGDGELRPALAAEVEALGIQGRVRLIGEIEPSSVGRFLACGDLFVFPSFYEAFGMAAAEAMQAGLPLVASNHPGVAEVVGNAGVLLDPTDEDAWVQEISKLRDDPDRRMALSTLARERGALFSFESMLDGYKALLE